MADPDHADLVITVACIRAIDGKPCRLPRNGAEVGRAMHRLGEVGLFCSGAFGRLMLDRLEVQSAVHSLA